MTSVAGGRANLSAPWPQRTNRSSDRSSDQGSRRRSQVPFFSPDRIARKVVPVLLLPPSLPPGSPAAQLRSSSAPPLYPLTGNGAWCRVPPGQARAADDGRLHVPRRPHRRDPGPVHRTRPEPGPAGTRSLGYDLAGGNAVGSVHYVESMPRRPSRSCGDAPEGASGVWYAGYQEPADSGTATCGSARCVPCPASGWFGSPQQGWLHLDEVRHVDRTAARRDRKRARIPAFIGPTAATAPGLLHDRLRLRRTRVQHGRLAGRQPRQGHEVRPRGPDHHHVDLGPRDAIEAGQEVTLTGRQTPRHR